MNCIIIPVATAIILQLRPRIVMGDNTTASSIYIITKSFESCERLIMVAFHNSIINCWNLRRQFVLHFFNAKKEGLHLKGV